MGRTGGPPSRRLRFSHGGVARSASAHLWISAGSLHYVGPRRQIGRWPGFLQGGELDHRTAPDLASIFGSLRAAAGRRAGCGRVPDRVGANAPPGEAAVHRDPAAATPRGGDGSLPSRTKLCVSPDRSAAGSRRAFRQLSQELHAAEDPAGGAGRSDLRNGPVRSAPAGGTEFRRSPGTGSAI
jgi:hypothetical protein